MALEIPAERMAYTARRECLLLSGPAARDGRANFGDARIGGRLEENARGKGRFAIGKLSQLFGAPFDRRSRETMRKIRSVFS